MCNRVHKERHTLKKNTAMIGENQTASCRLNTEAGRKRGPRLLRSASRHEAARPQDGSCHHTSTDNSSLIKTKHSSQLASQSTVQQAAGRRRLSAVLHTFGGRFGTAGKRRSALAAFLRMLFLRMIPIRCVDPSSYRVFYWHNAKGRERARERSSEECRLRCTCWEHCCAALFYRLSLAASGFIRSPVTAEPWPGAPGTPEGFTPTLTSRLQISINEIKVVLFCAFIYPTRDFRRTERKMEAR